MAWPLKHRRQLSWALRRTLFTVLAVAVCCTLRNTPKGNNKYVKKSHAEGPWSAERYEFRVLQQEEPGKEEGEEDYVIPVTKVSLEEDYVIPVTKVSLEEETHPHKDLSTHRSKPPISKSKNESHTAEKPETEGSSTRVPEQLHSTETNNQVASPSISTTNHPVKPVEEDYEKKEEEKSIGKNKDETKQEGLVKPPHVSPKVPTEAVSHGTTSTELPNERETEEEEQVECIPPAYHEFPPDLFGHYYRARGAIVIHILVIMYMFYAVAVVCDDYFIASLEECCNRLNLSEDVAGATFMAAGSSTPELFTAILGVLVAKGDVGTGTIVGSAVFNVLFVIGLCGIFAGRIVELTWWPLFRDSVFYSFTVIILIAIIFDSEVTWYESVIMMSIYSFYILLMKFNADIHMWLSRRFGIEDQDPATIGILSQADGKKNYSSYVPFNNEIDEGATARFCARQPADESIRDGNPRLSLYDASLQIMMKRPFRSTTRFRSAALRVILEHQRQRKEEQKLAEAQLSIDSADFPKWKTKSLGHGMGLTAESNWKRIPKREDGCISLIKWIIQAPLLGTLHYTIPDCREERWRRFFMLTFVASITWTAFFSYVMIWMVTLVGFTLGIPDSIMGITFLAAGTSVPDAFASLIVARQGQGDMAVSNSIGSNVFDILIGLALPWFIQTTMIDPGSVAVINSRGMVYSVILLFLTIIITIGGVYASGWRLTKRLGIILLLTYVVFLVISILIEFNLLGYVNPPMCSE